MTSTNERFERLPELPMDFIEQAGKLDWSPHVPIITLRTPRVTATPPVKGPRATMPTPALNRASHETRTYHAWVIYPHVVCTPIPDLEVLAEVASPPPPPHPRHPGDLAAVARLRQFYKLTRFHGKPLETPWGCEVRHGPWYATILYTQSCDDETPDRWSLASSVLDMQVDWHGTAADMPDVPNLTVIWDPNGPAETGRACCPGHTLCATTGSCLPNRITCQPQVPY